MSQRGLALVTGAFFWVPGAIVGLNGDWGLAALLIGVGVYVALSVGRSKM